MVSQHPNLLAQAALKRAQELVDRDRPQEALTEIERALGHNPDYGEAYFERGKIHYHRQDLARAEPDLRKAAELLPDNGPVLAFLGSSALRQNRFDEGLPLLQRAVALDPSEAFH